MRESEIEKLRENVAAANAEADRVRRAWENLERLELEGARVGQEPRFRSVRKFLAADIQRAWEADPAAVPMVRFEDQVPKATVSYEEYRERVEAERVARRRAFMGGE